MNFVSSFGLTIVTFATAFISSRVVIGKIGDERFGAFRSLFELFGYLSLLEGGLSITIRPLIAQGLAKNLEGEVVSLFNASKITYRFVMFVSMTIGILMSLTIHRIVPVSEDVTNDLRLASLILSFGLINIYFGPYRTLCEAMQQSFLTNLLLMAQSVCITITTMILCRQIPEWGISLQAFSIIFWVMFFNLLLAIIVSRLKADIHGSVQSSTESKWKFRELLKSSRDSFIFMLSGRATLQSNSLILGYFVGQADVTKLYATQRLFDVIQSQLFAVGNASWAAMAEIFHQNQHELFLKRIKQLIQLLLVMAISALVPVLFFNQSFVSLWVGSDRYGGTLLSCIMMFNTFAWAFTVFSTWCLTGTGNLKSVMRLTVVTGLLDVIATLMLTSTMGLVGPVLGSCTVLFAVAVPWHLRLLATHFGLSTRELMVTNLRLILFGLLYAVAVYALHNATKSDRWVNLIMLMGIPTFCFMTFSVTAFLDQDQKQILLKRFGIRR